MRVLYITKYFMSIHCFRLWPGSRALTTKDAKVLEGNHSQQEVLRDTSCPSWFQHFPEALAHGQHHAKSGFAADHLLVAIRSFFQGIAFDHGAHAGERAVLQRVFGIAGGAGSPSLNGFAATDELQRGDGEWFKTCAHDQ